MRTAIQQRRRRRSLRYKFTWVVLSVAFYFESKFSKVHKWASRSLAKVG